MATPFNKSMKLPMDNYILQCVEESFGPSKSTGNPMITLTFQVHAPDEKDIAGEKVTVSGITIKHYATTFVPNDAEKAENCRKRLVGTDKQKGLYQLFGLDPSLFNPENPGLGFKGKYVHARLTTDEKVIRKDPTPEQVAKGEEGEVMKNPVTGEELKRFEPKISEIYGLANVSGGAF